MKKRLLGTLFMIMFFFFFCTNTSTKASSDYRNNYPNGQCTWWVADCLNRRNGIGFNTQYMGVHFGDAGTWAAAAKKVGSIVDNNPVPGCVAWWKSTTACPTGHVAYVLRVDGDDIFIEEYNYKNDKSYHTRTIKKGEKGYPDGFIHICDPTPHYLDLNWSIDGKRINESVPYAKVDVYVDGTRVAADVSDFYQIIPFGSTYEIRNVRPQKDAMYDGIISGSLTGTMWNNEVEAMLGFTTKKELTTTLFGKAEKEILITRNKSQTISINATGQLVVRMYDKNDKLLWDTRWGELLKWKPGFVMNSFNYSNSYWCGDDVYKIKVLPENGGIIALSLTYY